MSFKTKCSWIYILILIVFPIIPFLILCLIINSGNSGAILTILIINILFFLIDILYLIPFLKMKYTLKEKMLHIKCGLLKIIEIPYKNIRSFKSVKSFDNDGTFVALSSDRVSIIYTDKKGLNRCLHISPKDKEKFLEEISLQI